MRKTRKCAHCGKEFVVNSSSQKFCCEKCAEAAKRERKRKVCDFMRAVEPVAEVSRQEYLTFAKAAVLMGCSRQYIYKLVNTGKLPASRLSSRMSIVRREDIEKMLAGNPYHRMLPFSNSRSDGSAGKAKADSKTSTCCKQKSRQQGSNARQLASEPIEYYSGDEVMQRYKVKKSWLYSCARKAQIPVCKIAGKTYYEKKAIDEHFGTSVDLSQIDEWLTANEAMGVYGMTKVAVRSYAHWHGIPTKREYGVTYYSKWHFDELRGADIVNDERYCTVEDVAKRYGMTSSYVCIIAKKKGVERRKAGRKWMLLRSDVERAFADKMTYLTE